MIYVMFSCNANKEFSSMRFLGATSSPQKLKLELKRLLDAGEIEFNQERFNPTDNWRVYDLNSSFDYVFIEEVVDGWFVK